MTIAVFAVLAPTFSGTMLLQKINMLTTVEECPVNDLGKVSNRNLQISQLQAS